MMNHPSDVRPHILGYFSGLRNVIDLISVDHVDKIIRELTKALEQERYIFAAGNGGSAATASHLACDLGKTTLGADWTDRNKRRFRVVSLSDCAPLITAWGNDVGFEKVFAEQLRNLARPGDVLIVLSVSGSSQNIVRTVEAANDLGMTTIGLLGNDGGRVRDLLDVALVVDCEDFGYVEDAHMIVTHLLTSYFKSGS